jgi:two-component system, OmpR family, alkaline phosphatase synthesis response regulator PhoP
MKKTILIVDDEPDVLTFLKRRLETRNYKVITASDGIEGLNKASQGKPDIILLDIVMPNKDGFTMLSELKTREETQDIPVVIISVRGESRAIFKGQNLGAIDYLIKPYDFRELLKYIKRYSL